MHSNERPSSCPYICCDNALHTCAIVQFLQEEAGCARTSNWMPQDDGIFYVTQALADPRGQVDAESIDCPLEQKFVMKLFNISGCGSGVLYYRLTAVARITLTFVPPLMLASASIRAAVSATLCQPRRVSHAVLATLLKPHYEGLKAASPSGSRF